MQRLREVGLHLDFAGADRLSRGTTESGEKIIPDIAVGNLYCARAERQALEFILGLRDLRDDVEQHLCPETAYTAVGEVARVGGVGLVGAGGELVSARGADVVNQALEVVVVLREALGQGGEQFRIRGGVADADVVHGFDNADAKKVRPDHVGEVWGEEWIFRGRQPLGHDGAAILRSGDLRHGAAEELGRHVSSAKRVLHLAAAPVVNDHFSRILRVLATYLGEEGGERVVVIHRPAVERVVVALGTLDAHTHEYLCHVFRNLQRVALDLVIICRRRLEGAAGGGEQLLHNLVERHVVGDAILQPVVIQQRGLVTDLIVLLGANLQQFGPFHHPHFGELLPVEQRRDEVVPLLRIFISEEGGQLVRFRKQAGDVQKTTAHEGFVGALAGGRHAQLVQFVVYQLVDVIIGRQLWSLVLQPLRDDDDLAADGERRETRRDKRLSPIFGCHRAFRRNCRAVVVIALEHDQRGDIPIGAVGVTGDNGHLLRRTVALKQQLGRQYLDVERLDDVFRIVGRAVLDPSHERVVVRRADVYLFAAGVWHGLGGFFDKQTLGSQGEVQPARAKLASDAVVIAVGIVAKKRQHEAVLPPGRAVARAGVAAGPQKNWHHIQPEANAARLGGIDHLDRHNQLVTSERHMHLGFPIRAWQQLVASQLRDAGLGQAEHRVAGDIPCRVVAISRHGHQRVRVGGRLERDLAREHLD